MYNVADKSVVNTVNQSGGNYSIIFSTTRLHTFTQPHTTNKLQKSVYTKELNTLSPLSTDHNKNKVLNI